MKKRLIIMTAFCYVLLHNTAAQETNQVTTEKKKSINLVKIETTTGESIEAALGRFAPDTVFVELLEKDYVKAGGSRIKILKEETAGIAVAQIRNLRIKHDPNIISVDELAKRKKELIRKQPLKIAGKVILTTVAVAATIATIPFGGVDLVSPVIATKNYRTYKLNGDNKKYVKMVKSLMKSKTSPFENNLVKN